jgi:DNA processing protein
LTLSKAEAMYVLGRLPLGGIAIIGSRSPPEDAAAFAYELSRNLGEPVIAGLAPGIDSAAHRGALAAGTPTVAFVAYGFGNPDPPENAQLEREIVERGGAIATLRQRNAPATDAARIERDRLQAEHARAIVLISSEAGGGAMHTMRFARELRKPRYAVVPPESVSENPSWSGNRHALRDGATPLPFDLERALALLRSGR